MHPFRDANTVLPTGTWRTRRAIEGLAPAGADGPVLRDALRRVLGIPLDPQ